MKKSNGKKRATAKQTTTDGVEASVAAVEAEQDAAEQDAAESDCDTAAPINTPAKTRYLRHELTEEEIAEAQRRRTDVDAEIEKAEAESDELKERAKRALRRAEVLTDEGRTISRTLRDGYDYRDVPCEEREERETPNMGQAGVGTYRLDTNERIEWRPLTAQERQGTLFDAPAS